MSLNTRPISVNVSEAFAPFSHSIATSLTRYLPFGASANGLSLGGCDIRKVFYTIFAEGENGLIFSRTKAKRQDISEVMISRSANMNGQSLVLESRQGNVLTLSSEYLVARYPHRRYS
jgi:hypothetical protein